jgi:hypothetical protein
MFVSNRLNGTVTELDISDPVNPGLKKCFKLEGNPDIVIRSGGKTVIPAGYQGFLLYSDNI